MMNSFRPPSELKWAKETNEKKIQKIYALTMIGRKNGMIWYGMDEIRKFSRQ